jgi:hypothetical protein
LHRYLFLGAYAEARRLFERALAICETGLGPSHPSTNMTRENLARVCLAQGAFAEALVLSEAALAANEKVLGVDHPDTESSARVTVAALDELGRVDEAAALRTRYGIEARRAFHRYMP